MSPAARVKVLLAFMCLALLMYAVFLGRIAVLLITSGSIAAIGMGVALLIMLFLGVWAMIATLRDGFAHQRLSRLIAEDGMELDAGALPRRPSGRIERDAADALFHTIHAELDADPDNWRRWYRLARAYEFAGDRRRAREAMKTAVALQAQQ
ncbi:hypothetical protein F0402_16530 [Mycolicibacter arupensis]|nr:hypothetical protein [Mycolicibacter arupensis]KAA1429968.1 hypothetical protein F0402_16530 [Mycolicibacter arupensis]